MIPRQLGLYISNSNSKEDTSVFAFYLAIRNISHEGVIHNYRSIILSLRTKLDISESCFRKLLSQCKREGYLFEDEARGLRFRSPKKILLKEMADHPHVFENKKGRILISRKKYHTNLKKYNDLKIWIKSLTLFNKSIQQNYVERLLLLKNGTNNSTLNPRAFQRNSFYLSRKHIASLIGYKSPTSATYFIKKLKTMGITLIDNIRVRYIKNISKYEYNEVYADQGKYYFKSGGLYRRLINELQLNTSSFLKEL